MPIMDGIEATRKILSEVKSKQLNIVALTAFASKENYDQCMDAGMKERYNKPLSLTALRIIIAKYFYDQD